MKFVKLDHSSIFICVTVKSCSLQFREKGIFKRGSLFSRFFFKISINFLQFLKFVIMNENFISGSTKSRKTSCATSFTWPHMIVIYIFINIIIITNYQYFTKQQKLNHANTHWSLNLSEWLLFVLNSTDHIFRVNFIQLTNIQMF